ncbi:DUF421 domain-containing protein [Bacillus timonensis]|uniref:DUF421 domain-containing protein n=1 Tax=Bacillus timonensis TaxID=1033734 RepID=A0A4S3PYH8_9BACI|nr:DUF421 domain-containing protein [Bacillus timonensis]THE14142.1 DUF421 domain-containing protein [Bacillus timonensis]
MPDWLSIAIRSLVLLIALFFFTKWLGKKQISQLSYFEYINGITIGSIAAEISTGLDRHVSHGLIGMGVWFAIPFIMGFISLNSKIVRDFAEGKGTVFIQDGKVMEDNLKKEKYTIDELLAKLRNKNVFQVADVEFAVLETDGSLSVLLKKENQPVTAKVLNLAVAPIKEPQTVIMDGEIMHEPLSSSGHSQNWLETELDKMGVSIENVFLGQVDSYGQLTVDLFDDKIKVPSPQEKPLLLATIKKCQADLELFALQTNNQSAKEMYQKNSEKLQAVLNKVAPYLKS